jgi:hypothetical protein
MICVNDIHASCRNRMVYNPLMHMLLIRSKPRLVLVLACLFYYYYKENMFITTASHSFFLRRASLRVVV